MKHLYFLTCILVCSFTKTFAGTITSNAVAGNWNATTTWVGNVLPAAGDSVIIADGATVTLTATATCSGLMVGQGGSGVLQFSTAAAVSLTVTGNTTISTGGTLRSGASGSFAHTFSTGGNFTNNGVYDALFSANNSISNTFTGASNQLVSGMGSTSNFVAITLSKTALDITAATNTVELNLSNFTIRGLSNAAAAFLASNSGTGLLKISGTNTFNGNVWNAAAYTIPASLGFWLNNPNFTINAQNGNITVSGLLKVSAGIYNGCTLITSFFFGSGTVIFDGGAINAAAKFQNSGTYKQSGGTLTTAIVGNNIGSSASFQASSNFTMSGGTIVLQNRSTGSPQLDVNLSAAAPIITGGTVQFGNSLTPAAAPFNLQGKTPSVVLDNSSGNNPKLTMTAAVTIAGDLTLNGSGAFTKGAFPLTMQGNTSNPGNIIVNGTNALALNGTSVAANGLFFTSASGNQSFTTGSGSIVSNQLPSTTINNTFTAGTVTIPSGLGLMDGSTLTLTKGQLAVAAPGNIVFGSASPGTFNCIVADGTLNAPNITFFAGTAMAYTYTGGNSNNNYTIGDEIPNGSVISSLTINRANATDVINLAKQLTIGNFSPSLTLTKGLLNTSSGTFILNNAGNLCIVNGGSNASYVNGPVIRDIAANSSGIALVYSSTNIFPTGKNGAYLPAYMSASTGALGTVQLQAEAFGSGATTVAGPGTVSPNYWKCVAINGTGGNINQLFMGLADANGAGSPATGILASGNIILKSNNPVGIYSGVLPASNIVFGPINKIATISALLNSEFTGNNYYAYGNNVCLAYITGPSYICSGASSQLQINNNSGTGVWSSSGNATVDANGLVTAASAGSANIMYTISSADLCNGTTITWPVTITDCSVKGVPGGVSNNIIGWWRGDGASTTTWNENLFGISNLTAGGTTPPAVVAAGLNFNPTARFSALSPANHFYYANADGWMGGSSATTYFYVATAAGSTTGTQVFSKGVQFGESTGITSGRNSSNGIYISNNAVTSTSGNWSTNPVNMVRSGYNNTGNQYYISANAGVEANGALSATPNITAASLFNIGGSFSGLNTWVGDVAEVIAYNGKQGSADYNKVQSYLAVKYGITLDQTTPTDYIASNGSTKIWNASTAGIFNHNILGIGRDNNSSLNQLISTSTTATTGNALVTLATNNDFTSASNAGTRTAIANDNSFLMIADDYLAISWTSTGAPAGSNVLTRNWNFQNTNFTAGSVIQFNVAGTVGTAPAHSTGAFNVYRLALNNNSSGSTVYSNSSVTSYITGTISGNMVYFVLPAGIVTGATFTLSETSVAPGGVSAGLAQWFKANANPSVAYSAGAIVSQWDDQSGNGSNVKPRADATYAAKTKPVYNAGFMNFNPQILFAGSTVGTHFSSATTNCVLSNNNAFSIFSAFNQTARNPASTNSGRGYLYAADSLSATPGIYDFTVSITGNPGTSTAFGSPPSNFTATTVTYGSPAIAAGTYTGAGGLLNSTLNNGANTASSGINLGALSSKGICIGGQPTGPPAFNTFLGNISEVIAYTRALSTTEQSQVNSYMALKYGVSTDQTASTNYIASDGSTIMWNAATAGAFNRNIFGIGRDDNSALSQLVSTSSTATAANAVMSISTNNDFATANPGSRPTIPADKTFLMIADNNGSMAAWNVAGVLAPANAQITNRVWQLQNTGSTNTAGMYLQADKSKLPVLTAGSTYELLVNNSATSTDFSSAPIVIKDFTVNGNFLVFQLPASLSAAANTVTFTVAAIAAPAPGGISPNLVVWLKADSINAAVNNSSISNWTNSIISGFTAPSQAVPANQPTWLNGANAVAVNHNPVVSFNAANSNNLKFSDMLFSANKYTYFAVANTNTLASWQPLLAGPPGANAIFVNVAGAIQHDQYNVAGTILTPASTVTVNQPGLYKIAFTGGSSASALYNGKTQSGIVPLAYSSTMNAASTLGTMNSQYFWNGTMSEVIMYNTDALTAQASQQIQSYLALKYGLTLDPTNYPDYLASDGSYMWKASSNASGFTNNIFGIGLDNTSRLDQRISTPVSTSVLSISTDANFSLTNASHAAAISINKSFEVIADNAGALTWTSASGISTDYKKLSKEWQVQETGSVNSVYLRFNVDDANSDIPALLRGGTYYLAVDPNGDGNYSDATITALTNSGGSNWATVVPVDFNSGQRFTIATLSPVDAGPDTTLCIESPLNLTLTGRSPITSGIWSAMPGNPAGQAILSSTVNGVATVSFNPGTKGIFNYIYAIGTEADTMTVTIGTCLVPGAVSSNLWLWFKADQGITANGSNQVMQWDNQAAASITTQAKPSVAGPDVTINPAGINYNPTVSFSGATNDKAFLQGLMSVTPRQIPAITYAVFKGGGGTLSNQWIFSPSSTNGAIFLNNSNPAIPIAGADANGSSYCPLTYASTAPNIVAADYQNSSIGNAIVRLNGTVSAPSANFTPAFYPGTGDFTIGARFDNVAGGFHTRIYQGEIAEILYYVDGNNQSAADATRIESSLAMKYGITLDKNGSTSGNYILSNNTKVWDASVNPAFHRDVVGIVRDDAAGLLQKQSRTADDSLRVFAGTLSSSNKTNMVSVSNNVSSIIIGNDGGRLRGQIGLTKPSTVFSRFGRVWKVTNTNFADNFGVEIKWDSAGNFNLNDIRLLVSDSPDFSNAQVWGSHDLNFYIGSVIVTGISNTIIPMNSTKFITIGSVTTFTALGKELLQFEANATASGTVNLNWQIAAASGTDYFTIERSADKNNWQAITTVNATGNVMVATTYNSNDKKPYPGVSYYRLKLINPDGAYSYSMIRAVEIAPAKNNSVIVYPNPAASQLTIKADPTELASIKLFNMMGQDVTILTRKIETSNTTVSLDVSGLARGTYSIKTANTVTKVFKR